LQFAICNLKERPQPAHLPVDAVRKEIGVSIAGAGLVSVLGDSTAETWSRLLRGDSISDHSMIKRQWGSRSRVAGLALDAARKALGEARWSAKEIHSSALVVGTSKGKVVDWLASAEADPAGVGGLAGELGNELGIRSARLTVSAACASGLLALIRGVLLIKSGRASRVLVVAAEASVHELFIASFRRLGVLARAGEGCRPFDQNRSGFLMSEAGAAICLEAASGGDSSNLLIEKMAMGADATHLIGGDARGITLRALLENVIDGRSVDFIHAHGTGTVANDSMELSAIEDCISAVGEGKPAIYSHKGAMGHSLGAAGLVSVVINRICHEKGMVPPGLGRDFMPMRAVEMNQSPTRRSVQRSVAIAAGFGGAMGAVSLVSPGRG